MRKSKRLAVVEELAQRNEDECAKALGVCVMQVKQAGDKLKELQSYQEEYSRQKADIGQGRGGAIALQNYIRFLGNLDQAVAEQTQHLQNQRQQLDAVKREWVKRHEKRKTLARLIEKYRLVEDLDAEKRLQKEIDDLVLTSSQESFGSPKI